MFLSRLACTALLSAMIGSTAVVTTGTSDGFVISGPAYPSTVCGTCSTQYQSNNDPSSTVTIEKNGPVEVVLKADWAYKDSAGNTYLRGTARMYFYQNKTNVKITSILRNADYGASNSFASAFKGLQAYELRTGVNLSGTLNYAIANDTGTPATGTVSGSDTAYVYQGGSTLMADARTGCGNPCTLYTPDTGYRITKNASNITTGTVNQYPQGWADIANGSGVGVEIGAYQFSAYGPKSLEFNSLKPNYNGFVATSPVSKLLSRQNHH